VCCNLAAIVKRTSHMLLVWGVCESVKNEIVLRKGVLRGKLLFFGNSDGLWIALHLSFQSIVFSLPSWMSFYISPFPISILLISYFHLILCYFTVTYRFLRPLHNLYRRPSTIPTRLFQLHTRWRFHMHAIRASSIAFQHLVSWISSRNAWIYLSRQQLRSFSFVNA
jgi:hypothetical protein